MANINPFAVSPENFKTPYGYESYIKAQALAANKRIADMDMFWANLEEATRQFEETLSFKEETRDLELEFAREQLEATKEMHAGDLALGHAQLASQDKYRSGMLNLQSRETALKEKAYDDDEEAFDFFTDYMKKEQRSKSSEDYWPLSGDKHGFTYVGPNISVSKEKKSGQVALPGATSYMSMEDWWAGVSNENPSSNPIYQTGPSEWSDDPSGYEGEDYI